MSESTSAPESESSSDKLQPQSDPLSDPSYLTQTPARFARTSIFNRSSTNPYLCQYPWPLDCSVQCGDNGVVFTEHSPEEVLSSLDKSLTSIQAVIDPSLPSTPNLPFIRTAFFEAFPRLPDTFIRGEGSTIPQAEKSAWDQYQQYLKCDGSNLDNNGVAIHGPFEPRSYQNGAGFCSKCGLWFPGVIPPLLYMLYPYLARPG